MFYFAEFYHGNRVPTRHIQLLVDSFRGIKSLLQAIFAATLLSNAIPQISMILTLEVAYFLYQHFNDIKVSLALRITDRITTTLAILYMLLKLVAVSSPANSGPAMAVIMVVSVYGIIVVSISFALFSLILILFQLCKRAILWCRSRSKKTAESKGISNPADQSTNDLIDKPEIVGDDENSKAVKPQRLNAIGQVPLRNRTRSKSR